MTKPSVAAPAVFGVLELVEMIVEHLPPRDLITVQRVSPFCRAAVQRRPDLQTRLFLSPSQPPKYLYYDGHGDRSIRLATERSHERDWAYRILELNDLLVVRDPSPIALMERKCQVYNGCDSHDLYEGARLFFPEYIIRPELLKIHPYSQASCLDMYITMPPATKIQLRTPGFHRPIIKRPGGVKLRDILGFPSFLHSIMSFDGYIHIMDRRLDPVVPGEKEDYPAIMDEKQVQRLKDVGDRGLPCSWEYYGDEKNLSRRVLEEARYPWDEEGWERETKCGTDV